MRNVKTCYDIYRNDIKDTKPLSRKEEKEIAVKIQKGDRVALNKLVCANLKFMAKVVEKYENQGVDPDDLRSYGHMGLIKAAYKFDPNCDTKFISYAVWWIRQAVLYGISTDSRQCRIPVNISTCTSRVGKYIKDYWGKHLRSPTDEEIETGTKLSPKIVQRVLYVVNSVNSDNIDYQNYDCQQTRHVVDKVLYKNNIATNNTTEEKILKQEKLGILKRYLNKLDPRTNKCLTLYYGLDNGDPITYEGIAKKLTPTITRERVRQIIKKGIKSLRGFYALEELHHA